MRSWATTTNPMNSAKYPSTPSAIGPSENPSHSESTHHQSAPPSAAVSTLWPSRSHHSPSRHVSGRRPSSSVRSFLNTHDMPRRVSR